MKSQWHCEFVVLDYVPIINYGPFSKFEDKNHQKWYMYYKILHFIEGLENIHLKLKIQNEWRATISLYLPMLAPMEQALKAEFSGSRLSRSGSPWAQRGHRAPPPPPGSSMSGIILFRGPHWSIIEMLTPYKLGRPHLFGHFSKWPPSKSSENWIAHILAFGQPRNTNLVSKPTFSRSLNPMGML